MSDLNGFRKLGISESTLDALRQKGFEEPTAIQAAAIPLLLAGERDVLAQAQTGTGKTAAFAIPIIETLEKPGRTLQALILTPTRELCIQVADEIASLQGSRRLRVMPLYGGQSIDIQLRKLKEGLDIVVGTPGRIMDLMRRGALRIDNIRFAVLDEADEMLNMGFIEDIESILSETGPDKRMLLFSATMPEAVTAIAERFMRDYETIRIKRENPVGDLTEQIYFAVLREDKLEALCRIIDMESDLYGMVFCRTKVDVDELCEKLTARGYAVAALHGDIAQAQRTRTIESFKRRKFNLLVATDVAARGIDVNDLTHVVNYSIPRESESYVHRIGRTGRAGKPGVAITFVTPSEHRTLIKIMQEVNTDISKRELPQGRELVERKRQEVAAKLDEILESGKHKSYVEWAGQLIADRDPAELLAALIRMEYKGTMQPEHYAAIGKKAAMRTTADKKGAVTNADRRGQARVFIALGKADGYGVNRILQLIRESSGVPGHFLGKVDCMDKFSFVGASSRDAEAIIAALRDSGRDGKPLARLAKPDEKRPFQAVDGDGAVTKRKKRRPESDFS